MEKQTNKRLKVLFLTLAVVLILWLAIAVYDQAQVKPEGDCEDQDGSICVAGSSCPDGLESTLKYVCFESSWTCCVPS